MKNKKIIIPIILNSIILIVLIIYNTYTNLLTFQNIYNLIMTLIFWVMLSSYLCFSKKINKKIISKLSKKKKEILKEEKSFYGTLTSILIGIGISFLLVGLTNLKEFLSGGLTLFNMGLIMLFFTYIPYHEAIINKINKK